MKSTQLNSYSIVRLKAFPLEEEQNKTIHLLLLLQFNIVLEVPVRAIRQENKIKAFNLKRKK